MNTGLLIFCDVLEDIYPMRTRKAMVEGLIQNRLKMIEKQREDLYKKYADAKKKGTVLDVSQRMDFLDKAERFFKKEKVVPTLFGAYVAEVDTTLREKENMVKYMDQHWIFPFTYENPEAPKLTHIEHEKEIKVG